MAQWFSPNDAPASADVLFFTDIELGAVEKRKNRLWLDSRKECNVFVSAREPHRMVSRVACGLRASLCPPLVFHVFISGVKLFCILVNRSSYNLPISDQYFDS